MKIKAYSNKQQCGKGESFSFARAVNENDVFVKVIHCDIVTEDIQLINND
jgi:hypothetical protein